MSDLVCSVNDSLFSLPQCRPKKSPPKQQKTLWVQTSTSTKGSNQPVNISWMLGIVSVMASCKSTPPKEQKDVVKVPKNDQILQNFNKEKEQVVSCLKTLRDDKKTDSQKEKAVESLVKLLGSSTVEAQTKLIAFLIDSLRDNNEEIKLGALRALEELLRSNLALSSKTQITNLLISALKNENTTIRELAVNLFRTFPHLKSLPVELKIKTVDPLIAALQDESGTVQWRAADSLGSLVCSNIPHESITKIVDVLIEKLEDEGKDIRRGAINALGKIVASDSPNISMELKTKIIGLLIEIMPVEEEASSEVGNFLVATIPPNLKIEIVVSLVKALDYESAQWRAALSLGKLGEAELPFAFQDKIVAQLIQSLWDKNEKNQTGAALGLMNLAESSDFPVKLKIKIATTLLNALPGKKGYVQFAVAMGLNKLASSDIPSGLKIKMIRPLFKALKKEEENADSRFRGEIISTLNQLTIEDIPQGLKNKINKALPSEELGD